jgi:hypothetical protein
MVHLVVALDKPPDGSRNFVIHGTGRNGHVLVCLEIPFGPADEKTTTSRKVVPKVKPSQVMGAGIKNNKAG